MRGWAFTVSVIAVTALALPASASARVSCSFTGAPDNRIDATVTGESSMIIERRGDRITAREFLASPMDCGASVASADLIRISATGYDATADLDLGGGAFAPGLTPESDGSPEIEVEFDSPEGSFLSVLGTQGRDDFRYGRPGGPFGVNLNPGASGDGDVDVTVSGFDAFMTLEGRAGSDVIKPMASAGRAGDVFAVGGDGNDLLVGANGYDILEGGRGRDTIFGHRGADDIQGAQGRDTIRAGSGSDDVGVREGGRDRVRCGPGNDSLRADTRDRRSGCERVKLY